MVAYGIRCSCLYLIHYVNSKICVYTSSHEEMVLPMWAHEIEIKLNSLTLRFLSKIDRTTRALMIDFVMSIMTNCLLLELPERCKPRHAFLVERNE